MLDDEPVLVALTLPADRVSFFGELLLRVFPLRADRSRTGHGPLVAFKSRCNVPQGDTALPRFHDLDGDGRPEILCIREPEDASEIVSVVRFPPS
jgi:hypothetical protein